MLVTKYKECSALFQEKCWRDASIYKDTPCEKSKAAFSIHQERNPQLHSLEEKKTAALADAILYGKNAPLPCERERLYLRGCWIFAILNTMECNERQTVTEVLLDTIAAHYPATEEHAAIIVRARIVDKVKELYGSATFQKKIHYVLFYERDIFSANNPLPLSGTEIPNYRGYLPFSLGLLYDLQVGETDTFGWLNHIKETPLDRFEKQKIWNFLRKNRRILFDTFCKILNEENLYMFGMLIEEKSTKQQREMSLITKTTTHDSISAFAGPEKLQSTHPFVHKLFLSLVEDTEASFDKDLNEIPLSELFQFLKKAYDSTLCLDSDLYSVWDFAKKLSHYMLDKAIPYTQDDITSPSLKEQLQRLEEILPNFFQWLAENLAKKAAQHTAIEQTPHE